MMNGQTESTSTSTRDDNLFALSEGLKTYREYIDAISDAMEIERGLKCLDEAITDIEVDLDKFFGLEVRILDSEGRSKGKATLWAARHIDIENIAREIFEIAERDIKKRIRDDVLRFYGVETMDARNFIVDFVEGEIR